LRPVIERTLGRLLGARDPDHDDLVQQALIDLVLSLERFRGECPLDAWAAVIAARTAYKHIRRRKIERRLFVLTVSESFDRAGDLSQQTRLLFSSPTAVILEGRLGHPGRSIYLGSIRRLKVRRNCLACRGIHRPKRRPNSGRHIEADQRVSKYFH
jgi:hypothetical protein